MRLLKRRSTLIQGHRTRSLLQRESSFSREQVFHMSILLHTKAYVHQNQPNFEEKLSQIRHMLLQYFNHVSLQAINSPEACKKRLFKYVVPVLSFSSAVNLPKFFESYVEAYKQEIVPDGYKIWPDDTVRVNGTIIENLTRADLPYEYEYYIEVTDFRKNTYYTIYYTNWTRLLIMGIIPTVLLIYFNYKVIFGLFASLSSSKDYPSLIIMWCPQMRLKPPSISICFHS